MSVPSLVDHAVPRADDGVTAREEDADATCAELCEQVAHAHRILVQRDGLLAFSVRRGDRLLDVRIAEHVVEPNEVWFVRVGPRGARGQYSSAENGIVRLGVPL